MRSAMNSLKINQIRVLIIPSNGPDLLPLSCCLTLCTSILWLVLGEGAAETHCGTGSIWGSKGTWPPQCFDPLWSTAGSVSPSPSAGTAWLLAGPFFL